MLWIKMEAGWYVTDCDRFGAIKSEYYMGGGWVLVDHKTGTNYRLETFKDCRGKANYIIDYEMHYTNDGHKRGGVIG